jgi:hypothetical protein
MIQLNLSWLNGKFANGELNPYLGTVAVEDPEFFAQGDDAYQILEAIRAIWLSQDCSVEQAFQAWISLNL